MDLFGITQTGATLVELGRADSIWSKDNHFRMGSNKRVTFSLILSALRSLHFNDLQGYFKVKAASMHGKYL